MASALEARVQQILSLKKGQGSGAAEPEAEIADDDVAERDEQPLVSRKRHKIGSNIVTVSIEPLNEDQAELAGSDGGDDESEGGGVVEEEEADGGEGDEEEDEGDVGNGEDAVENDYQDD